MLLFAVLLLATTYSQPCVQTIPNADWDYLVSYKPPTNLAEAAASRDQPVLSIFEGRGDKVNLDYWGITISKMPFKDNLSGS